MTQLQLEIFNAFLLKFTRFTSSRLITPIYRGDTLQSLYDKLGVECNSPRTSNHREVLRRLFLIGDKSKNYLSGKHLGIDRSWTFGIDETSERVYNFIFDVIADCAKRHKAQSVQHFFNRNESFKEYFLNKPQNKEGFYTTILGLPEEKQIKIRNYYLKLLHQIGSINYKKRSHLVSTSRSYSVAEEFASGTKANNGIIIHAWEPVYSKYTELKKHNLPRYTGRPYERQSEISVIAGIFPHYIIALEVLSEERLYVNPNIFCNPIDKNIFLDGLDINQSRFVEVIQKTKYSKYVTTDGTSYYDNTVE